MSHCEHNPCTQNITDPILLIGLQLFDAIQEALFGAVEVIGQAADGDFIRLLLRSRHLNINLDKESKIMV